MKSNQPTRVEVALELVDVVYSLLVKVGNPIQSTVKSVFVVRSDIHMETGASRNVAS